MSPAPLKKFGQHFLTSPAVAERIVAAAELAPRDTVLEIGPGTGVLTELIRRRAGTVIAMEIDPRLADGLREIFAGNSRVAVIGEDVLQCDLPGVVRRHAAGTAKVIANLPFNITVRIMERLFRHLELFGPMVLVVQREMADKFTASPHSKAYGQLSMLVQYHAAVRKLFTVAPGSFFPRPKVRSTVISMIPGKKSFIPPSREEAVFGFVRACFGRRRKMLRAILRDLPGLGRIEADDLVRLCPFSLQQRPEDLTLEDFWKLYKLAQPYLDPPRP